jgi:hypothetical protein
MNTSVNVKRFISVHCGDERVPKDLKADPSCCYFDIGDVIFIYNKDDIEFNYISLTGVRFELVRMNNELYLLTKNRSRVYKVVPY